MSPDEGLDPGILESISRLSPDGPCPPDGQIVALRQGLLSEAEADAVREHVAMCRRCLETTRDARRFVAAMQENRPTTRAAMATWRILAAAAALAGVAIWAGTVWIGHRRVSEDRSAWAALRIAPAPCPAGGGDDLVWRGDGARPGGDALDAATVRYRAGDWDGAVTDLASYVSSRPDDPHGRFYLGVARLMSGRSAAAATDLEAALDLPGAPADARWYLALARLKSGNTAGARPELERVAASESAHRDEARRLLDRLSGAGGH